MIQKLPSPGDAGESLKCYLQHTTFEPCPVDILEESYNDLVSRLDDLLTYDRQVRDKLLAGARELRAPKSREGEGHLLMRPLIQKAVSGVVGEIVQQNLLSWDEVMARLMQLD